MDRPLLFLVIALVAVGVFLYLRRQDDEANTPSTGGGVPFDTDATARIKELDAAITDLTRRFSEFDTLANVLSRPAVSGITDILGEIVQVRAELQSMDVDSAESGTRKAVVSRLDKFSRTVETVVRAAKVDQARVSSQPTEAAGPVNFSPMFTAAPNVGERAVEFSPMGSETTKPVFGYPNVNETLAPPARVRPEEGVTGRERFPGVKVSKVVTEGTLEEFQKGARTEAKVLQRSNEPKAGTQEESDAKAAAAVHQVDPHKPPIPAEVIHAKEPSQAKADREQAHGAIQFDAVDAPKQLVVVPVGKEAEAAATLLQMLGQPPANADGTGGISFDSAPKRDQPETFEGDEQEMLLAKTAADPNNPARNKEDPKTFMKALRTRVEGYVAQQSNAKQLGLEIAEIRALLMAEPASSKLAVDVFDPVRKAVLTEFNILEKRLSKTQAAVKRPREAPLGERAAAAQESEDRAKKPKPNVPDPPERPASPVVRVLNEGHEVTAVEDVPRADPNVRSSSRVHGVPEYRGP